ncbi:putative isomerase YbhE [Irpex rosettiformis]|uniref:Isomerase YbhE n=1 Tax=Irpex rosettiformis TaxID=378272 RepID=A0ACB8U9A3_9APHY|nr:putative isomerase YbhE [Irpex rosettiformis]
MAYRIYVGSYTNELTALQFDSGTSSLTILSSVTVGYHPSWLTPLPSDRTVIFTGLEQSDGKIVTVKYDEKGQALLLGTVPSGGADPCALLADGDELLIGNYSSGILHVIPLKNGGSYLQPSNGTTILLSGTGPNKERQEGPHPHQVLRHPDRPEILVPDLGTDKVWRLTKDEQGIWTKAGFVEIKAGGGPRHAAVYNNVLYTVLELSSEVTAHRLPPLPEKPTLITTVPTMSKFPGDPEELGMLCAEILLPKPNTSYPTPYLYASNRNDPSLEGDVIAIFSVADPEKLELVAEVRSGLKHLRGMLFGGPDDRYLAAGGVLGGGVKVFERVDGGKGLKEVASVELEAPTGFLWA